MLNMNKILEIHGTKFFNFLQWFDMTSHTEADSDLVCQPGIRWLDINEALQDQGLCSVEAHTLSLCSINVRDSVVFPCVCIDPFIISLSQSDLFCHQIRLKLDPAPEATIGGMLSTGCSGSMFNSS